MVEWAGLVRENNTWESGNSHIKRFEMSACSPQLSSAINILFLTSPNSCAMLCLVLPGMVAIEVLGGFAAGKWYTQPPPKPKPVKLPDSTPKVIKDAAAVQMAVDQDSKSDSIIMYNNHSPYQTSSSYLKLYPNSQR